MAGNEESRAPGGRGLRKELRALSLPRGSPQFGLWSDDETKTPKSCLRLQSPTQFMRTGLLQEAVELPSGLSQEKEE